MLGASSGLLQFHQFVFSLAFYFRPESLAVGARAGSADVMEDRRWALFFQKIGGGQRVVVRDFDEVVLGHLGYGGAEGRRGQASTPENASATAE